MAKMKPNQRVVKSVPDRKGNVYNKTAGGGSARTKAAVRYMDKHEEQQLYTPGEDGRIRETDRHEAAQRIDDTESKYQQHMVFTTELKSGEAIVDEKEYAQMVSDSVKEVRPDADIYAVSVRTDKEGEGHIHAHVTYGTDTTIRKEQLNDFRQHAYEHEKHIREHGKELDRTPEEKRWIDDQQQNHHQQQARQPDTRNYQQDDERSR